MRAMIVILAVTVVCAPGLADDEDDKKANDTVLRLADALSRGNAEAIKKPQADVAALDLDVLMARMKLRKFGGTGFGEKPPVDPSIDGVEAKLRALVRNRAPSANDMQKQSADLLRIAWTIKAISSVNDRHAEAAAKKKGADPADWKQYNADMGRTADEFIKAIKDGNPEKVKDVATRLNNSCSGCHTVFR